MFLLDPYKVDTSGASDSDKKQDVALVDLRASGNHAWLQKPMEIPYKWFLRNHGRIPLLKEILQAIREPKSKDARAPRCRDSLVALKLRDEEGEGRVLWFKNESRFVLLAVKATAEGLEDFTWFLKELQSDIAAVQEEDIDAADAKANKELRPGVPADIQGMVRETVESLQDHPQCAAVKFLPSKNAMKLVRNDKVQKRITIKQLRKLRSKSDASTCEDAIQRQFDRLQAEAIEFLDGDGDGGRQEPAVPASALGGGGGAPREPASHASDGASDSDVGGDSTESEEIDAPKNFAEPARTAAEEGPAAEEPAAGEPAAGEGPEAAAAAGEPAAGVGPAAGEPAADDSTSD